PFQKSLSDKLLVRKETIAARRLRIRDNFWLGHSTFEAASSTFQPILNEMRPDELDDSRVVVAVCEVVIQSRKTSAVDRISSCQPAVRHRTSDDRCFPSQMAKHTLGNRAPQCHRSSVNSSW